MNGIALSRQETASIHVGEALTIATIIIVFTVVILTITAYKLFASDEASFTLPNGFKFSWEM